MVAGWESLSLLSTLSVIIYGYYPVNQKNTCIVNTNIVGNRKNSNFYKSPDKRQ